MSDQAAPDPDGPTMNFHVDRGDDQPVMMNDHDVVQQYQKAGYPVAGVTSDGLNMITQGPAGPNGEPGPQMKMPITQALKNQGYKIHATVPINPDPSTTEPFLSGMVDQMPEDDGMRKSYIEHTLQSRGVDSPQVTGAGNNWHVFNPATKQWAQLSAEPGFDLGGLASLGLGLPHMIGSLLGGTAGAVAGEGIASIPAAAAGGAAGSLAGSGVKDAALAAIDPDYAAAMQGHMNSVGTDALKTAGLDAVGEGIGGPLAKVGMRAIGPAADALGAGLEGAGFLTSKAAGKAAGSDMATNAISAVSPIPGVPAAMGAAEALQAPQQITSLLAKTPSFLAKNPVTSPLFSEENAAAMDAYSQALHAQGNNAEGILGGLVGGRAKNASAAYLADPAEQEAEDMAANGGMQWAQRMGITDEDSLHEAATDMAKDYRQSAINRLMGGSEERNLGHTIGSGIDKAASAGNAIQGAANATTKAGLRGLQGLGTVAELAGSAVKPAAMGATWAGLPWAVRYGLIPFGEKTLDENQNPP